VNLSKSESITRNDVFLIVIRDELKVLTLSGGSRWDENDQIEQKPE
jgi:hypothetical protein